MSVIEINEIHRTEKTRLSQSQFGLMVDFMTLNPELASRKWADKCDKSELNKKWEQLAALLNLDETGAQKNVAKWKKSWADLKNGLRSKIEKLGYCIQLPGIENQSIRGLTELERRAWNLITSKSGISSTNDLKSSDICNKQNVQTLSYLTELDGKNYVVLSVDEHASMVNATKVQPDNNIVESHDVQAKMECGSDVSSRSKSINSEEDSSEESRGTSEKSGTVNDKGSKRSSDCENVVYIKEINQKDDTGSAAQISSSYTPRKRLLVQNRRVVKRRKKESGLSQLLQRQNELLENIAQSISRIEKTLEVNSPQPAQGKNDILSNIVENIDRITESFDSVSTSLKKMAAK